jgi:uncharacterized protein (TIGR01777 family)
VKTIIAGGTGFLGSRLASLLAARGEDVVILTRDPERARKGGIPSVNYVGWDLRQQGPWGAAFEGADAVVNLVGESIAGWRWTRGKKQRILESRLRATRALVQAIRAASVRPHVFISASAVNYYDSSWPGAVTESSPPGQGFLAEVTVAWEREASHVVDLGVRLVLLRIGIVLDASQGALPRLLPPFRWFIGGPLGSGRQWFPWIHSEDVAGIILTAIERDDLAGPLNGTAPGILTMNDFCSHLGHVLHRPSWFRVPASALRLMLGEMSVLVLRGAKVLPERLLAAGYRYRFPELEGALQDLLADPRKS